MRRLRIPVSLIVISAASCAAAQSPTIYRCETASGITFSDRPCGIDSKPYEVDTSGVSVIETKPAESRPAVASPKPQPPSRAIESSDRSSARASKAAICERLDQSLRKVLSTMRTGYTASQGERLRERKRELEAQRRAQRC